MYAVANAYTRNRSSIAAIRRMSPTLTQQQYQKDCDVNRIMAKYLKDGIVPRTNVATGTYGDFPDVDSYYDAMLHLETAKNQFNSLPAKIRDRFQNDPAQLLDFVHNAANKAEAQALGLLASEPPAPPPAAPAATTDAPK